ncbi:ABC transporter ATP-binding protein [Paludibaculum fermentans]|uniref:ABC transporter ATP-binding protein n=1 Tax=Paludibaculum fermentans TaxID=1473598 RepID=UPI003EB72157
MSTPQEPPILIFDDVSFGFDDNLFLRHVSFELMRGETLIIHGAAGSGKTLLLKLALGLLPATSGQIHLFGQEVTRLPERDWFDVRSRIGVLFQEGGLFDSFTIEENVGYPLVNQRLLKIPPEQVQPKVEQSLEFVELGHTMDKFPSELSGGMRRRVGIARAIVTQPELLLYDSPTAGLDPITANNIIALIVKGRDVRGATTVIVTHRHQDGEILERYRYNENGGGLRPVGANGDSTRTRYMVMKEGAIAFLGASNDFDCCKDPYVAKFASR